MRHLLLVIPARNEEQGLRPCIERLVPVRSQLAAEGVLTDALVVVNNSADRTYDVGVELAETHPWLRVERIGGRGKGLAVRYGWLQGTDLVAFTDVDLAADITALPLLLDGLLSDEADIVVASRYLVTPHPKRSRWRGLTSYLYRLTCRSILRMTVRDAQCGLKAATIAAVRPVLEQCSETGWLLDSEMLFVAQNMGLRIRETPVAWREGTKSNLRTFPTVVEVVRFLARLRRSSTGFRPH